MYLLICKIFPLPPLIITDVDVEIPLNVCNDLCECGFGITTYAILYNWCLPMVFCWPPHTASVLLRYHLMVKVSIPLCMHASSAVLIPTLRHNPLAILLNMLKLKVLQNGKLFHCVAEVSHVEECSSNNELHFPWSSARWSSMITCSFSKSSIMGS